MTDRIDHGQEARRILDGVDTLNTAAEITAALTGAHVHTTLALVEQQRTANLIAYVQRASRATVKRSPGSERGLGL